MLLEVKGIQKSFQNTEVLKNINFSLEKGKVLSIIGSSGSGKTTLLRCLNFLETPDAGQIILKDKVLYDGENKSNVSDEELRWKRLNTQEYQDLAARCKTGLRLTEPLTEKEENRPRLKGTTEVQPKR